MKILVALMMLVSSLTPQVSDIRPVLAMKSGVMLRMHVIAQDDTPQMQALKLIVRDEVRRAYAQAHTQGLTMLAKARSVLPELNRAAQEAARAHGYEGQVTATVEAADFDERSLDGHTFPAGRYPALIIRMGDAQGQNWWGLVDPDMALQCAAVQSGEKLQWTWDWRALLHALWPEVSMEVSSCE